MSAAALALALSGASAPPVAPASTGAGAGAGFGWDLAASAGGASDDDTLEPVATETPGSDESAAAPDAIALVALFLPLAPPPASTSRPAQASAWMLNSDPTSKLGGAGTALPAASAGPNASTAALSHDSAPAAGVARDARGLALMGTAIDRSPGTAVSSLRAPPATAAGLSQRKIASSEASAGTSGNVVPIPMELLNGADLTDARAVATATDSASAAAAISNRAGASAGPAPAIPASPDAVPLDHHFDDALGARVSTMLSGGVEHARIQVAPAELGPIEIHIAVDGDQVQLDFTCAASQTREALDAGVDRLRGLLGERGLNLVRAEVSDGHQQSGGHAPSKSPAGLALNDETLDDSGMRVRVRLGLLDEFA